MPPALGPYSIITGRTGSFTKIVWHFPLEDAAFSSLDLCQTSTILFGFVCANYIYAKMVLQFPEKGSAKILCFEPVKNFWQTFHQTVLVVCALVERAAPGSMLFAFLKSTVCMLKAGWEGGNFSKWLGLKVGKGARRWGRWGWGRLVAKEERGRAWKRKAASAEAGMNVFSRRASLKGTG